MSSRGKQLCFTMAAVLAGGTVAATPAAAAPAFPRYTYVDLGVLGTPTTGEYPQAMAYGVNNAGDVAGDSTITGIYNFHGFARHNGVLTDLGTLAPGPYSSSSAAAINDLGVVAGSVHVNLTDPPHAFHTVDGVPVDLGTGAGAGSGSHALDINSSGTVVGSRATEQGAPYDGVVWRDGKITVLGTLGGQAGRWGTNSVANAVNDHDQVVGEAVAPDGAPHAFRWTGSGPLQDLGTLGGVGNGTYATGINDAGQIVGASGTRSEQIHATLWRNGGIRDLGTLGGGYSEARGINASGQVVGSSRITGDAQYHAFVWQSGRMVDLNKRVPGLPAGVTLVQANGINDHGAIVGYACPFDCDAGGDSARRAFLLTPIG